jgi:hypothetical protein
METPFWAAKPRTTSTVRSSTQVVTLTFPKASALLSVR